MLVSIREHGQGLVEYVFLLVLIALVVFAVLLILGPTIGNVFSSLNSRLTSY
jgi:Flp pilus assembly pilin Flp